MPLGNSLPYGLRDVQLIKYPTLEAIAFGSSLVDLPNAQTLSFTDSEEYTELRGDDKLITSHGQGSALEWELESGGISFAAYAVLNGGVVIETGIAPNQSKRYRKYVTDQRPFFTAIGQSISDSGGDFHALLWLCRSTGEITGELKDGEFLVPGASGTGFPCRVTGTLDGNPILDALYDFVQHESILAITAPALDTPTAPLVYSLSDVTGPVAGGEIIVVQGNGFGNVTAVTVGGTPATDYQVLSSTQMIVTTPAHAAGAAPVLITNTPGGTSVGGAQATYTYV